MLMLHFLHEDCNYKKLFVLARSVVDSGWGVVDYERCNHPPHPDRRVEQTLTVMDSVNSCKTQQIQLTAGWPGLEIYTYNIHAIFTQHNHKAESLTCKRLFHCWGYS